MLMTTYAEKHVVSAAHCFWFNDGNCPPNFGYAEAKVSVVLPGQLYPPIKSLVSCHPRIKFEESRNTSQISTFSLPAIKE